MLCTFTTRGEKTLIVRSDDIRAIEDYAGNESRLVYMVGNDSMSTFVQGTATENAVRIQQEELDLIARVEEHRRQLQQRMAEGYPAVPVQRGKQR
jgi:hypothetical protein